MNSFQLSAFGIQHPDDLRLIGIGSSIKRSKNPTFHDSVAPSLHQAIAPFFLLLAFALAGCAGQVPPSGGPVDKTPPQIVYSSPSQRQLNFDSREVVIRFDKYMTERAVENAIYFPPFNSKQITFDWSGKEITVKFLTPLEKDRTYIMTIGAGAEDTRGNSIGKAINLVFATGSHIDTGSVSGRVYSGKTQAYTVSAYPVTDKIDTLRPSMDLAKYVTQSDDSGRYVMQGLAVGKYRLICFDDQMRNFTYAPQMDDYASATHDIELADSVQRVSEINFMPSTEDTSHPQLYGAELSKNSSLLLKFSQVIDSASIFPKYFFVRDSITAEDFTVGNAVRCEDNKYNVILGMAKPLPLKRTYVVTALENVRDLQSNTMSQENNTVVLKPDSATANPSEFYFNFRDSVQNITTYDTLFCQIISPIVFRPEFGTIAVSLRDSAREFVPGGIVRRSTTIFGVSLASLKSLGWYSVEVKYRIASSEKDSVMEHYFRLIDFSSLGDIEGEVMPAGKKVLVVAAGGGGKRFFTVAGEDGKFHLGGIVADTYTLSAYVQHVGGVNYFSGKSYLFRFAEPFGVYPTPIKVRSRWTSEGAVIKLF